MTNLSVKRVVLYKHGIGYFEREGRIEGDTNLSLTFKQAEVSDVLKSLTVLDLDGGHIASVSYDSTKPLAQLLAEVTADPDRRLAACSLLSPAERLHLRRPPELYFQLDRSQKYQHRIEELLGRSKKRRR